MNTAYYYELPPIDIGWAYFMTPEFVEEASYLEFTDDERALIKRFYALALRKGRQHAWEGDFKTYGRAKFFALPNADHCVSYGVVWKQNNNGTTFLASMQELAWLKDYLVEEFEY